MVTFFVTMCTQAVDSQTYSRSVPSRELNGDKMDVLIKVVKAMNSAGCKDAVASCYTKDCLGCANSTTRRDLVMEDEPPMTSMMFYGFNYTCDDLFEGTRTALECTGGGDLSLYCDTIGACYGTDDM